jgi:hypothetical protein
MTHREFLLWLKPQLDRALATGLSRDAVRGIRDALEQMRREGALQPFASKLQSLVRDDESLDAKTVEKLATEVRLEMAPRREKTVVFSADPEPEDPSRS